MLNRIINFLFVIFILALPIDIKAANLYFDPSNYSLNLEASLRVDFLIDTQDEFINAFEGRIIYPADYLELVDIKENNSIIDFWLTKPSADSTDGEVNFSGIVPGGHKSNRGQLFSLYFISKKVGNATLDLNNARVLLNDGLGTEADLNIVKADFVVREKGSEPDIKIVEIKDSEAPEDFWPIVTQAPDIAGDKFILIFSTKDKESGVDYYEVKEGWGFYKKAISPYIIKNQNLDTDIYVKAVDKNGNERIVKVSAKNPGSWYEKINFSVIIISFIIIVLLTLVIRKSSWSKSKNKKKKPLVSSRGK